MGAFVFFQLYFFMDFRGASGEEIRADQKRNAGLIERYPIRDCKPKIKPIAIY